MPALILPDTFLALLTAFTPCFHAPSAAKFTVLVAGWVHCLGRHTITAVVLAAGAMDTAHISTFHRFFARAQWRLDAVGQMLFTLAVRWIPADQPLYLLGDDTLARKGGKCIALGSMHHDPLRSTGKKPFFAFGHLWVVLALWVPLPVGRPQGFALPILVRLYVGAKRGGTADAVSRPTTGQRRRAADTAYPPEPRPTRLALLKDMVARVAQWGARPQHQSHAEPRAADDRREPGPGFLRLGYPSSPGRCTSGTSQSASPLLGAHGLRAQCGPRPALLFPWRDDNGVARRSLLAERRALASSRTPGCAPGSVIDQTGG